MKIVRSNIQDRVRPLNDSDDMYASADSSRSWFFKWYDSLPLSEQDKIDDIADEEGIPYYEDCSDSELSWLMDKYNNNRTAIYSADAEEDEDDIKEIHQEFTSKETAVNGIQGKLPAIFKLISVPDGSLVLDYGGGKPEAEAVAQAYLDKFNATEAIYDPFNQTAEHNKEVVKKCRSNGGADIALCSNVLNVIKEKDVRINVLENIKKLTSPSGVVYITVYEGSGSGQGSATQKGGSYQNNRKTADYLEEVQEVFPNAKRKGKLIVAKPGSVESATNTCNLSPVTEIDAGYGGAYDIEDDMYFTRDDINEFGYTIADELSSSYGTQFDLVDCYMEDPSRLHMEFTDGDSYFDADIRIDMRKIKLPSDLIKYEEQVLDQIRSQYSDCYGYDVVSSIQAAEDDIIPDNDYVIALRKSVETFLVEDIGIPEDDAPGMYSVDEEYEPAGQGEFDVDMIYVEISLVGDYQYSDILKLVDIADDVIKEYDSYAYFSILEEDPVIISAYMGVDE